MSETTLLARYRQLVSVLATLARSSHEVTAVVQTVHQQAGSLFPAQVTLLALQQPAGDWHCDVYEDARRYTQPLPFYPEGILESVLHGQPLSIPDIAAYLELFPGRFRRVVQEGVLLDVQVRDEPEGQRAQSMLYVPLEVRGRRAGVLSIQSYERGAFGEADLKFLLLLAQHVSIALENAALREELARLTRTDALTGLLNRRAFSSDVPEAMAVARRQGQDLSLVLLDVHEFKRINDTHGHQVGDAVLALLGQVMRQCCAAPDAAFRLGGDEFALLVWDSGATLEQWLAQLTGALRAATWPAGLGPVCLQAGAALLPPSGDLDEWLALADARMYAAKRQREATRLSAGGLDFGDGGAALP